MNNDQQHQLGQVSFGQAVPLDRRFTSTDWIVLAVGIVAHAIPGSVPELGKTTMNQGRT